MHIFDRYILSKDVLVPDSPGQGLACGPQGHTSVLENDDGNSTNMTGKLTSFANHACCRKFRVETESKGGQRSMILNGGKKS